jgi:hypothetical protein
VYPFPFPKRIEAFVIAAVQSFYAFTITYDPADGQLLLTNQ